MQIRCTFCQTMYAISHEETLAALERMEEEHLTYYEAHCPRCRRATRVERFKLEASYPTWREDLKQMAKQAGTKPAPIPASPAPKVEIPAVTAKKHSHRPAGVAAQKPMPKTVKTPVKVKPAPAKKVAAPKAKPAAKATQKAAAKPAAKKPAVKKPTAKPAAKKPMAKPAAKKPAAKKPAAKPAAKKPAPKATSTAKKPAKKPVSGTKKK